MAASATPIQNGCSPWSARCSDQLTVTSVRRAVISAASDSISEASTSQIAAAQAASRRTPSLAPVRYASSCVPAGAALAQEALVVRARRDHRVREAHHQRDVGVRPRCDPARGLVVVDVAPDGADVDEVDARLARRLLGAARAMPREAARVDLRVLEGHPAEGDDQLGVLGDLVPVRGRGVDRVGRPADDVRQDDLHRGAAVAVDRRRVAAVEVEEAVQQALRVVEAPRASPAVRAAVDGCVAVLRLDAGELARRQVECLVPADLDERVLPASRAAGAIQPAAPHGGTQDAARVILRARHADADRRRVRIAGGRVQRDDRSVATSTS